jgi:hypothetical protein
MKQTRQEVRAVKQSIYSLMSIHTAERAHLRHAAYMKLSITILYHNAECHSESHILFLTMLCVSFCCVHMVSVVMLNAVMVNVVAP